MHVDIIIPTYQRPELLKKTIHSIRANTHKDVSIIVVIDGNPKILKDIVGMQTFFLINQKRLDWVASQNRALAMTHSGAVIYAADDLIFDKFCIKNALKKLPKDTDALVTITQNVKGCSTAFGLLGRKFIERFPNNQVFCPDYVHYGGDAELGRYARSIGKLRLCPEATVIHKRLHDQTYLTAKPQEKEDFHYIKERKEKGLLCGRDFKRLKK